MSKSLLVDRGALIQLALPCGPATVIVDRKLSEFDVIAVETGGASALRGALLKRETVRDKLYIVKHTDYENASRIGFELVNGLCDQATNDKAVQHEIRRYIASRQPLAENAEMVIKYVLKLFFLAYSLEAHIFLANYRFLLYRSIIESIGGMLIIRNEDILDVCILNQQCRLFQDCRLDVRRVEAFAINDATQSGRQQREEKVSGKHVFLSYCHDNTEEVQRFRDDLTSFGIKVWWDKEIQPGQDWKFEIKKSLRTAGAFILCLSNEALSRQKSGLFPEANDAISQYREYQPGSVFIIPVRLTPCEIPMIGIDSTRSLDDLQYVDLFPEARRSDGIDKIVKTLKSIL